MPMSALDNNISAPTRFGKPKRAAQIGVTDTTFLALRVWIGPDRASFLMAIAAILTIWFWLCRRFPTAAWIDTGFIRALTGR
jgi:hypothetical protein